MLRHALLSLLFPAALTASAPDPDLQAIPLDPNIGTALNAGDDVTITNLNLGFPFLFPNLTVYTTIDVDSNGRIFPAGLDTFDASETVGELLGQATSICPFWDDLDPSGVGADDIYFNVYHNGTQNVAVITWKDMTLFDWWGQLAFTFQLQLFDNGRFVFVYDGRAPIDEPLVGISQGGGAINPGSRDFSSAATFNTGTTATVYEDFPFQTFDLQGVSLEFVPNGTGGYNVNYKSSPAAANPFGTACISGVHFTPDGSGNYIVTRVGAGAFDPVFGTSVLNTGDEVIAASNNLGFMFPWPGGTTSQTIDIETNGRILPAGGDATDFSPTVAELLTEPHPTLAVLWADFTFSQSATDNIFFKTAPGVATITWDQTNQFRFTRPCTFQAVMRQDGSFTYTYVTTATFVDAGGQTDAGTVMVGCSGGNNVVDPGERDFAAGSFLSTGNTAYEFWDPTEIVDMQLRLVPVTRPFIGSPFRLQIHGIPAGTTAAYLMIGFQNLNAGPLDPIGMPSCFLYSSNDVPAVPVGFTGPLSSVFSLPISASTPVGIPLVLQAATVTPGASALPVILSNAIVARTGTL